MLNTKKLSEICIFYLHLYKEEIEDESNHNGAEQESLLEQERFVWTEIRNLYSEKELEVIRMSRGLDGGYLLWTDRQAGWQVKISLFNKILKSCNSTSNWFWYC